MTVLPHPVSPLPRTAPDCRPYVPGPTAWAPGLELPVWLVTMPTVAADGTRGTQWIAVRTHTADQAIADATVHAGSAQAVLRRRGARICIEQAHAALWQTAGA
ncbi:hypothetical protein ACFWRD_19470 [Streptomyces sindenensis]|uniref:hypothetical protein n=1 Tax=Streptomyces sindenensis TaxID=67363 RepID=UPI0036619D71